MKDIKNIILVLVVVAVVAFIGLGAMKKGNEFKEVSDYVNKNQTELEKIAKEYLNGNEVEIQEDIEKVEIFEDNGDKLVFFKLKSKSSKDNSFIGFYYSKNNIPSALAGEHVDIVELGGDKYKWVEEETEGITNKITDNWYFYKKTK